MSDVKASVAMHCYICDCDFRYIMSLGEYDQYCQFEITSRQSRYPRYPNAKFIHCGKYPVITSHRVTWLHLRKYPRSSKFYEFLMTEDRTVELY